MTRAFVAISLPEPIRAEVVRVSQLARAEMDNSRIRWVTAENLHITMQFLGEIDGAQLEVVQDLLRKFSSQSAAVQLELGGFGFFGAARHPRVLWVGVNSEAESLDSLHCSIVQALDDDSGALKRGRFSGHITIGRVKEWGGQPVSLHDLDAQPLRWSVNSLELIESTLTPAGPRYQIIDSFPFGESS